jgi:hypothetical protein
MADPSRKRRWPRFSVRTMVVLVLVAGLGLSWVASKFRAARRQREAVEAIVKVRGEVDYGQQSRVVHWALGQRLRFGPPPRHAWLRDRLGDDLFESVTVARLTGQGPATDSDAAYLAALPDLEEVCIDHVPITDAGLAPLAGLAKLRRLRLTDVPITDAGLAPAPRWPRLTDVTLDRTRVGDAALAYLGRMSQLRMLSLQWTRVTDAGLAHLKDLRRIEWLDLTCTDVTDAGLVHLRGIASLKFLYIGGTGVTSGGRDSIRAALPRCDVGWWPRHGGPGSGGPDIPEPKP